MTTQPEVSVLHDVLRVYDRRFLDLDGAHRRRLVQGTRQVLGDGLTDEVRAALPSAYRLRAFCIQHGLDEELERLIRDEADGRREGAVVVGGRAYAVYPYLRGVPRQDADITGELEVAHRLDALAWTGDRLRVRGWAAIERIEAREVTVALLVRDGESTRRFPATEAEKGFEALIEGLPPGEWTVHVAVTTLGVTREAPLGPVRGPKVKADAPAHFTDEGHLALRVAAGNPRPATLRARLRHLVRRLGRKAR